MLIYDIKTVQTLGQHATNLLVMTTVTVRLRGLRASPPGSKGHPRSFYNIDWKINKH